MKLMDEWDMSVWAMYECKNGNDIPEIRNLIVNSYWAFHYCVFIKDRPEIRIKITSHYMRDMYNHFLKDGNINIGRMYDAFMCEKNMHMFPFKI